MTEFHEMAVELILPNRIKWSWHHSFQKTMFYLMKSNYDILSNIKVTKIKRSVFFFVFVLFVCFLFFFFFFGGTPGILFLCYTEIRMRTNTKSYTTYVQTSTNTTNAIDPLIHTCTHTHDTYTQNKHTNTYRTFIYGHTFDRPIITPTFMK